MADVPLKKVRINVLSLTRSVNHIYSHTSSLSLTSNVRCVFESVRGIDDNLLNDAGDNVRDALRHA